MDLKKKDKVKPENELMIRVKVKTGTSQSKIIYDAESKEFDIWTHAGPVNFAANVEVVSLLAKFFKIARSQVELIRGHKSKIKYFKIIRSNISVE